MGTKKREFTEYRRVRKEGASPAELYQVATTDGLSWSDCFRMLREVCRLSPLEAKEVIVTASGEARSLDEYQARLVPGLERALDELEDS